MRSNRDFIPTLAIAICSFPFSLQAQPASADIEPEAIAALKKMGSYLRSLKAFAVEAKVATEEVLTDGQKVTIGNTTNLLAKMPDRLRAETNGDWKDRLFLYNGRTFTMFARRLNYYGTVPAAPTITELANNLEDKYDIEIPLVDLFRWGGPRSSESEITSAMVIGPGVVEGTTCQHYSFRQPGLDWQIWIQQGEFPLPRKLILTTLTDEARPQHASVYTWNLAPSFNEAAFEFQPPAGASKIAIAEAKK